jgi:hypothetical protein
MRIASIAFTGERRAEQFRGRPKQCGEKRVNRCGLQEGAFPADAVFECHGAHVQAQQRTQREQCRRKMQHAARASVEQRRAEVGPVGSETCCGRGRDFAGGCPWESRCTGDPASQWA